MKISRAPNNLTKIPQQHPSEKPEVHGNYSFISLYKNFLLPYTMSFIAQSDDHVCGKH
jgi:hypothetical protein